MLDDISRSSAQLEGGASQVQVLENELSKERTKVAEAQVRILKYLLRFFKTEIYSRRYATV